MDRGDPSAAARSTSCSTSATGAARWSLATEAGPDPAAEALRRLGVMRVATKYPRIAARHFEETGRQAEIVEVKGSVELAPLTGIGRGDRRPDGDRDDAAREQPRRPRGDRRLHRPADRQPGRPQAEGGGDRRSAGAAAGRARAGSLRIGASSDSRPARTRRADAPARACAARAARTGPGGASVAPAVRGDHRRACARRATRRVATTRARFDTRRRRAAGRCSSPRRSSTPRSGAAAGRSSPACRWRSRTSRERRRRPASDEDRDGRACRRARRVTLREVPVASAGRLRARRPRAVPEHGRDGRRHRACGRRARRRRLLAARRRRRHRPGRSSAPAGCAGVERVYRMGGAQAIAALASAPRRSAAST